MFKKLFLISLTIISAAACYTETDIIGSKTLFTYKGDVYDVTDYDHPGGQNDIEKLVGNDLSAFVNSNKLSFHLEPGNQFFDDMDKLKVGSLCPKTTLEPSTSSSSTQTSTSPSSIQTSSTSPSSIQTSSTSPSSTQTSSTQISSTSSSFTQEFTEPGIINFSSHLIPTFTSLFLPVFLVMIF